MILEIPSGNDRFELEVSPPFGEENIIDTDRLVEAATGKTIKALIETRGWVFFREKEREAITFNNLSLVIPK